MIIYTGKMHGDSAGSEHGERETVEMREFLNVHHEMVCEKMIDGECGKL